MIIRFCGKNWVFVGNTASMPIGLRVFFNVHAWRIIFGFLTLGFSFLFPKFVLAESTNLVEKYPDAFFRYTVKKGDTLSDIAQRYYGNSASWRGFISSANETNEQTTIDPFEHPERLPVGFELVLDKNIGVSGDIEWHNLSMLVGPDINFRSAAYNDTENYWLLGGSQWFDITRKDKRPVLYRYDGTGLISITSSILELADEYVTNVLFDGQKFWITTHDGRLIFYDGKRLLDQTFLLDSCQSIISKMIGTHDRILFLIDQAGPDRNKFCIYTGSSIEKVTIPIPANRVEPDDIAFNGREWLVSADNRLYKFDGTAFTDLMNQTPFSDVRTNDEHFAGVGDVYWSKKDQSWIVSLVFNDAGEARISTKDHMVYYRPEVSDLISIEPKIHPDNFLGPSPFGLLFADEGPYVSIYDGGSVRGGYYGSNLRRREVVCHTSACLVFNEIGGLKVLNQASLQKMSQKPLRLSFRSVPVAYGPEWALHRMQTVVRETKYLDYDLQYPQFISKQYGKLNRIIRKFAESQSRLFDDDLSSPFELRDLQQKLKYSDSNKLQIDLKCDVGDNSFHIVSVWCYSYFSSPTYAHPGSDIYTFNYDPETQRLLRLQDVLDSSDGFYDVVMETVKDEYSDHADSFPFIIPEIIERLQDENFEFTISQRSLTIFFHRGAIWGYVMPNFTITIPLEKLEPYLNVSFTLAS